MAENKAITANVLAGCNAIAATSMCVNPIRQSYDLILSTTL
ncbi:hypothetical protein M2281_003923 [Mesorhizobium soli]|nr:hypothetical protein [Mesorhizobium soli]